MNDQILETDDKKLEFDLTVETVDLLKNLSRWTKFTGLIIVIFGLFYSIAVLTTEGNFIGSLITLGIGIFIVFIGSRLTATSGYIKNLGIEGDGKYLLLALENLRQFFKMSGIIISIFIVMLILTLIAISALGLGVEELLNS